MVEELLTSSVLTLLTALGLLVAAYVILLGIFSIWYCIWIEIDERRRKDRNSISDQYNH